MTHESSQIEAEPSTMQRLQVMLPPKLIADLRDIAKARGIGTGTLIRMLLLASIEKRRDAA